MQTAQKYIDRFFAKTRVDHGKTFDGSPCIIWTASTGTKNGHGRFWDGRRYWVAHQFAYALQHGSIPDGMVTAHRCRNKLCVNHLHLEPISPVELGRRCGAMQQPSPTFRCCGREKTPENSYGGPGTGYTRRCKHCLHAAQMRWRHKPGVQDRINAQQRARKKRVAN